ncbi:protein SSUH2, partial [Biomphalaria glabrata]
NIPNGYGSYPPAGGAGPGMNQGQGYPPPQGSTPSYHQGAPPPKEALARPNEEVEASAPPPDGLLDSLPGYANIGFQGAFLPPPAYSEVAPAEPQNREAIRSVVTLTEEQAREAIIQFAAEHCCYGKGPAVEMKLNSLESSSAFHYTLETFGEGRSTKWKSQPYRGEGIIPSKLKVEVPNTASVKPCHVCHARGYKFCYSCMGSGRRECGMCNGTGRRSWYENGENIERPCGSCNFGWCTARNYKKHIGLSAPIRARNYKKHIGLSAPIRARNYKKHIGLSAQTRARNYKKHIGLSAPTRARNYKKHIGLSAQTRARNYKKHIGLSAPTRARNYKKHIGLSAPIRARNYKKHIGLSAPTRARNYKKHIGLSAPYRARNLKKHIGLSAAYKARN